jgi:hypothetical protein
MAYYAISLIVTTEHILVFIKMQIMNGLIQLQDLISADGIVIILPYRILEERTMSLKDGIQNFKAL